MASVKVNRVRLYRAVAILTIDLGECKNVFSDFFGVEGCLRRPLAFTNAVA